MTSRRLSGNPLRAMVLTKTVQTTLHKDLQLSKKSTRWVTKRYEEMKKDRLTMCKVIKAIITVGFLTITFSLWMSQKKMKELANLPFTQEAS
jgi:hypothetical protein